MKSLNIYTIINEIFDSLENNNFATLGMPNIQMYQTPLVGIAAGDDPYFSKLKEHIGDFHWTPQEAFDLKYGKTDSNSNVNLATDSNANLPNGSQVDPSTLRVVSMVFPQSKEAQEDQKKVTVFPSDKWLVSRGEWEPLMQDFSGRLVKKLEELNIRSVSIDLQDEFHLDTSQNIGIASTWSHRHAAYAAGLGTFGLTDAIITEKGTAVRITSLIVEAPLDITPRAYSGIYDWCLHYQGVNCDACVPRCPANALSSNGHDKKECGKYEDYAEKSLYPSHIEKGDYIFGCGICQVAIPCQNKKP